jgi:hypothetical protein
MFGKPILLGRCDRLTVVNRNHLVNILPVRLGAFSPPSSSAVPAIQPPSSINRSQGQAALLHLYAPLSFSIFKQVIESPQLPAPTDMDRFNFAKRSVGIRLPNFSWDTSDATRVVAALPRGSAARAQTLMKTSSSPLAKGRPVVMWPS